jgi:hypothetical protein
MPIPKELNAKRIITNTYRMVDLRTRFPYAFMILPLPNHSTLSILKTPADIDSSYKYYILSSEGLTILSELSGEEKPHAKEILSLDCLSKIFEELSVNPNLASEGKNYTQTRYHGNIILAVNYPYGLDYFRDFNPIFEEKFLDMIENINSEYSPLVEKDAHLNIS